MPLYEYIQNNSGGGYANADGKLAPAVYIEASSASEADAKAEELGIYFGGVALGVDCDCCGDRWEQASEVTYTREELDTERDWLTDKIIYYRDGRVERAKGQ